MLGSVQLSRPFKTKVDPGGIGGLHRGISISRCCLCAEPFRSTKRPGVQVSVCGIYFTGSNLYGQSAPRTAHLPAHKLPSKAAKPGARYGRREPFMTCRSPPLPADAAPAHGRRGPRRFRASEGLGWSESDCWILALGAARSAQLARRLSRPQPPPGQVAGSRCGPSSAGEWRRRPHAAVSAVTAASAAPLQRRRPTGDIPPIRRIPPCILPADTRRNEWH